MTNAQIGSPGTPRSFPLYASPNASASKVTNGNANGTGKSVTSNGKVTLEPNEKAEKRYKHIAAAHYKSRSSVLSHDRESAPSFLGFRNLMVIVLVVSNLRLMIENFIKASRRKPTETMPMTDEWSLQYGVLICVRCHDIRGQDIKLGLVLYLLIPCHLLAAYTVESAAARQAERAIGRRKKAENDTISPQQRELERKKFQSTWKLLAFAHGINSTLCLCITTITVYFYIHHPFIGTFCELHAIIVWLKNISYAFTNRDLRHAFLSPTPSKLPETYSSLPYPRNITLGNLTYFWWAPTLVYQPVYPRSPRIRWMFVLKRLIEVAALSTFIWIATAQYAAPVLRNSLKQMQTLDITSILERLMKLSTISLVIWLAGFFALFQSFLNALAELMRFGDREFYTDWWNSPSVGIYWRTWNKPVYTFMKRHVFIPLVSRGWNPTAASAAVFFFSGVLHELLVGVPTHNIIGVAFLGMVGQSLLIAATAPLEKMRGVNGKIVGNCIFWISFCLVGQPLAALLYFFAWSAKYGTVSKQVG